MFRTCFLLAALSAVMASAADKPFCLQIVDEVTGRGVPLVIADTMTNQRFVTDSAGRIAFSEPGEMGVPVFFSLRSDGYEFRSDGFGFTGGRFTPQPGEKAVVKAKRLNIAERLCRLTGAGIYRDSVLLGEAVPLAEPLLCGGVTGQDTVNTAVYHGRLFWLWGDTMRLSYPLGNFHASGAWSDLPGQGGLPPARGVDFHYLTGTDGFCRPLCPMEGKEGLVWLEGLAVVTDEHGAERMVANYARRHGMEKLYERGVAVFDDITETFVPAISLPLTDVAQWRFPCGHPTRVTEGGVAYLYFGPAGLQMRVPATLEAVLRPEAYEAWTCADSAGQPRRVEGRLDYAWRKDTAPVDSQMERRWLKAGQIKAEECRLSPLDATGKSRVTLHRGSVYWNAFRQRWIMIATQEGGESSHLGEVWYAEATSPLGPWPRAVKIATHDRYTFYNPTQQPAFDEEGGRTIYFEGTYSKSFSGRNEPTPLYDYNQVLYRLDLTDPRLKPAQP